MVDITLNGEEDLAGNRFRCRNWSISSASTGARIAVEVNQEVVPAAAITDAIAWQPATRSRSSRWWAAAPIEPSSRPPTSRW